MPVERSINKKKIKCIALSVLLGCSISTQVWAGESVSMVKLIVNPKPYIGKRVEVKGFLPKSRMALFMMEDSAKLNDGSSAIIIEGYSLGEPSDCILGLVRMKGKLISVQGSLMLTDITHVYSFSKGEHCKITPLEM